MFGLFQNTPQYAGNGQPTANSNDGVFGFLSGLFASSGTPSYAVANVRPSTNTGAVSGPAPSTDPTCMPRQQQMQATHGESATSVVASDPLAVQPACSVPLPFAIVIQRAQS